MLFHVLLAGLVALLMPLSPAADAAERIHLGPGPAAWQGDLSPIASSEWSYDRAAHLLERAGFGCTPEDIERLAAMTPDAAVRHLVYYELLDNSHLPAFDESDVHDPGLVPFPPSRPATTQLAKENGEALGVKVKPSGNRRLQPVVNKFFYWLRASMLETRRVSYWWAHRMLNTNRPLEEKMALFWHGHFATSEAKVRDYRKMLLQNETFRRHATGNFRDLVVAVAQDPAMLYFLDAGVNVKGAPNENFAREIMELFTMGVGNYSEQDIREAARAFTGWNSDDLTFVVNTSQHDDGAKSFLGYEGNFRRRAGRRPDHGAARHRRVHGRQALPLPGAAGPVPGTEGRLGGDPARQRIRDETAVADGLPVQGLLQRRQHGHAHQKPDRTGAVHLQEARRRRRAGHSRFQTWSSPRWGRNCSGRPPSPAGRTGAVGSPRACCWSAAISPAPCCSRTSTSSPATATSPA